MDSHILLSQLRALLARAPSFENYTPTSQIHLAWLGQAFALVSRWDRMEGVSVRSATEFLGFPMLRQSNRGNIFAAIHRAIGDLEHKIPAAPQQSFGPGAVYDFFRALNQVLSSAERTLFILDPYLDDSIFDTYLSAVARGVSVRLLIKRSAANVTQAAERFAAQHGMEIELRSSRAFHDRVIFIDDTVCWVLGQSINAAATSMPAYLAPLSPDVAEVKRDTYEQVWREAQPI